MARRMFTDQITRSDAFLKMPQSSRELYFQLISDADDDGFVNNPITIMRIVGATADDMNILELRKFIISFESGVIVIKHWRIHNLLRQDRYKPTVYQNEMAMLDMKDNKAYTLKEIPMDLFTQEIKENNPWQPNGNQRVPQVKEVKEVKEVKRISIEHEPLAKLDESETLFNQFWDKYPRKIGKDKCYRWFKSHKVSSELFNDIMNAISNQLKSEQWKNIQYIPHPYTWLNRGGWNDELDQKEVKDGKDSKPTEKFKYIPRRDRQPRNDETNSSE